MIRTPSEINKAETVYEFTGGPVRCVISRVLDVYFYTIYLNKVHTYASAFSHDLSHVVFKAIDDVATYKEANQ